MNINHKLHPYDHPIWCNRLGDNLGSHGDNKGQAMTRLSSTPSHPILILAAFSHMLLGLVFFATWIGVVFLLTALAFCAVGIEWK